MKHARYDAPEELRHWAGDCELLAREAGNSDDREVMLSAATRWRELADEKEARAVKSSGAR
jgi:hypothetical protein